MPPHHARRHAGPVLSRPVAVQVGVVTNDHDVGRAIAFFNRLGYRARSVGSPRTRHPRLRGGPDSRRHRDDRRPCAGGRVHRTLPLPLRHFLRMRRLTRNASPDEETWTRAVRVGCQAPVAPPPAQQGFGWAAWRSVLGRVYVNLGTHHLSIVAAGVAFFGVLAIFPALASLVALYGLIADPGDVAQNLGVVRPLLPPDAYGLLETQVRSLVEVPQQRLGFASAVRAPDCALVGARRRVGADGGAEHRLPRSRRPQPHRPVRHIAGADRSAPPGRDRRAAGDGRVARGVADR